MKRLVLITLILLSYSMLCFGSETDNISVFENANQLYQNKDYSSAIFEYLKIVDAGVESSEVYYNLGNSYYRVRKTAEAIYFYEKALKLNPDDDDIKFNLNIANLRVVDKFETLPKFFITEWYEMALTNFSSTYWGIIAVLSIWVAAVLLSLFLFVWNLVLKKSFFAGAVIALFIFIVSLILTFDSINHENRDDTAVIFSSSVYVKSAPDDSSTDLFILHEGTKVSIQDNVGDWLKIRLPDGTVGWMSKDDLKII